MQTWKSTLPVLALALGLSAPALADDRSWYGDRYDRGRGYRDFKRYQSWERRDFKRHQRQLHRRFHLFPYTRWEHKQFHKRLKHDYRRFRLHQKRDHRRFHRRGRF